MLLAGSRGDRAITTTDLTREQLTEPIPPGAKPLIEGQRSAFKQSLVYVFVLIPFLAVVAAIPFAWGRGLSGLDLALAVVFYVISASGITVGFHRYFTHSSFKANRGLKIYLAIAGSLAVEGSVIRWVTDHRRHHAFSDREGDPHSPWRFGDSATALAKGFFHAHIGWLFETSETNREKYSPDLLADRDLVTIDRSFGLWVGVSLLLPPLIAFGLTGSVAAAISAFFWASLVRIALLHHVTWSINSVCHMIGDRPYSSRDRSANFWPLAILSLGESWHNSHHADPTCARHGVDRGQLDISARMIWAFERLGWARDVRWPKRVRFDKLAARRASERAEASG